VNSDAYALLGLTAIVGALGAAVAATVGPQLLDWYMGLL